MESRQAITFCIKNMICSRCIYVVKNIFKEAHYTVHSIKLGEVIAVPSIMAQSETQVNDNLRKFGLELLQKREHILIEQIKVNINKYIYINESIPPIKLSDYLSEKLGMPYAQIRKFFKEHNKSTIEKFYILQKVERTKELIQYNELSIKEIAYKLGYSSLQHLSNQFKAITGSSPKAYKDARINARIPLDMV